MTTNTFKRYWTVGCSPLEWGVVQIFHYHTSSFEDALTVAKSLSEQQPNVPIFILEAKCVVKNQEVGLPE